MKVIDILKQASEMLSLFDETKLLNNATEETESTLLENEDIKSLFNLFKFSLQEICTNYMPIVAEFNMQTASEKYEISNLTNYIRIQGVFKNEMPVKYKIINRQIIFNESDTYTIKYESYPTINSMFEEINYFQNFSPDILVFGLTSYYTLSKGRFEEFEIFHNEYIDKAESLKSLKSFTIPQRRWEWKTSKELN